MAFMFGRGRKASSSASGYYGPSMASQPNSEVLSRRGGSRVMDQPFSTGTLDSFRRKGQATDLYGKMRGGRSTAPITTSMFDSELAERVSYERQRAGFNARTGAGTPRVNTSRLSNPIIPGEALISKDAVSDSAKRGRTLGINRFNSKSTTSSTRAIGGDVGKKAMRAGRSLGRTTTSAAKTVGKGTLAVGGAVVGAPVLAVGAVGFGAYRGARKAGRAMAGGMRRSSSAAPITASPPTTAPIAPITASPPTTAPRAPMNPNASGGGLAAGTSAPSPKSARSLGGRTKGFLKTKSGKGLAIGAGAAVIGGLAYSGRRGEGSSGGRTGMTRY